MLIQQLCSKLNQTPVKIDAISAQGLEMVYRSGMQRIQVLKDIDLCVPRGQIQFLMGPSGSGKTTLLSILSGLMTPTHGTVHLLGREITRLSRSQLSRFRLENIGFVFQGFNLFAALTAAENVEVALNLKGCQGKNARHQSQILLETVRLGHKAKLLPRDLSGGEKQRVAIARALAGNPPLIMADEPTASLDSESGQAIIGLLQQLARERHCTVLLVTHDPRIIHAADNILYMEDGQLRPTSAQLNY